MALTKEQLNQIAKSMEKMETVEQVFSYLANTFDLNNTKVTGMIVGPKFKEGMIKAIQFLNPPLKK